MENIRRVYGYIQTIPEKAREKMSFWKYSVKKDKNGYIKAALIIFIIFTFSIFSLIRSNCYYMDDQGRFLKGYWGWQKASRYISIVIGVILSADTYLFDVSPLSQILAAGFLGMTAAVIAFVFREDEKIRWYEILAVLPVGLCPYFLSCYSFKFDAPCMAASQLFAVLPFLFYKDTKKYYVLSFLCTICMCMTYQASSGIYPMMVMFLTYFLWSKKEKNFAECLRYALQSAAVFAGAILVYKVFFVKGMAGTEGKLPTLQTVVPIFLNNAGLYYARVAEDFGEFRMILFVLAALLCTAAMVIRSKRNKLASLVLSLLMIVLSGMLVNGIYSIMTMSLKPRYMIGFGPLLSIICIHAVHVRFRFPAILTAMVISWCFFVFCFVYGNAIAEQTRYYEYQMTKLAGDLNHLPQVQSGKEIKIKFNGQIGYAPPVKNMAEHAPVLKRLLPSTAAGYIWNRYRVMTYYNNGNLVTGASYDMAKMDLPVLVNTRSYVIQGNDEYLWVKWKR